MSLIGDLSDPVKDVAALKPLADHLVDRLFSEGKATLTDVLDGLTVTVTVNFAISKKPPTPGQ